VDADEAGADRNAIVQLDPDHPGFRDQAYRARRNQIAQIARSISRAILFPTRRIRMKSISLARNLQALQPAHQKHACAEYLLSLGR